jgi:hypothetical protein
MRTALSIAVMSILVGLMSLPASGRELPKGWRLPSQMELSDVERKDSPAKYARGVADFNGRVRNVRVEVL